MKVISNFLLFLLGIQLAAAQTELPDDMGYVRFMNLVDAGEGTTKLTIDGEELWKPGYKLGQITGALPLRNGSHKFLVTKDGCLPTEKEIDIQKGKAQTIVSFAEEIFDEEGNSLGWQIKLADMEQHTPESGLMVTFVSFCKEDTIDIEIDEAMSGKMLTKSVPKRRSTRVKLVDGNRARASVTCNGEYLGTIKADTEGNYVAMIFDAEDGSRKLKVYYDPEFMMSGAG